jgi:molybdopterin converting factor small subunit
MAKVFPPHELAKLIGNRSVEIEAATVGDLITEGTRRFGDKWRAGVARTMILVNGFNVNALGGLSARLRAGDRVHFITASAGG